MADEKESDDIYPFGGASRRAYWKKRGEAIGRVKAPDLLEALRAELSKGEATIDPAKAILKDRSEIAKRAWETRRARAIEEKLKAFQEARYRDSEEAAQRVDDAVQERAEYVRMYNMLQEKRYSPAEREAVEDIGRILDNKTGPAVLRFTKEQIEATRSRPPGAYWGGEGGEPIEYTTAPTQRTQTPPVKAEGPTKKRKYMLDEE